MWVGENLFYLTAWWILCWLYLHSGISSFKKTMCQTSVTPFLHLTLSLVLFSAIHSYGIQSDWSTILSGKGDFSNKCTCMVRVDYGFSVYLGFACVPVFFFSFLCMLCYTVLCVCLCYLLPLSEGYHLICVCVDIFSNLLNCSLQISFII